MLAGRGSGARLQRFCPPEDARPRPCGRRGRRPVPEDHSGPPPNGIRSPRFVPQRRNSAPLDPGHPAATGRDGYPSIGTLRSPRPARTRSAAPRALTRMGRPRLLRRPSALDRRFSFSAIPLDARGRLHNGGQSLTVMPDKPSTPEICDRPKKLLWITGTCAFALDLGARRPNSKFTGNAVGKLYIPGGTKL